MMELARMLTDIMMSKQVTECQVEQPATLLEQNFVLDHQKCNTAQDGLFVQLIVLFDEIGPNWISCSSHSTFKFTWLV